MGKTSKKGQKAPFFRMARRAGRRRRRNGPHQSGERQSPHRAGNGPENGVSAEVFATFTNMVNDSPCWCPHVASVAPAPRQPFSSVFSARPPFQPVGPKQAVCPQPALAPRIRRGSRLTTPRLNQPAAAPATTKGRSGETAPATRCAGDRSRRAQATGFCAGARLCR